MTNTTTATSSAKHFSVLLAGICSLILGMGIARYSFTPMIPGMLEQVGVDDAEGLAGWLAGINYVGYLCGLFVVWLISDLRTKDFMYRYCLFVAILATMMMAASDNELVWYASRFIAGVSTAIIFMLGTGLIMNWLHHNEIEGELGYHFSGLGFGIVVCALVVDFTALETGLGFNWRLQWIALAAIGFLFFVPALLLLPMPKEKEIEMAKEGAMLVEVKPPSPKWLWFLTIAYFCAGLSNTLNVTFTSMMAELQPLNNMGAKIWFLVGVAAIISPVIWDKIARKLGSLDALRMAFVLNIAGNIILASKINFFTTAFAAGLFGFTFMGIVSLTLSTVARLYGTKATQIMAQLTLFYCIAQIISPISFGQLAGAFGTFSTPLYVVSFMMALGLLALTAIHDSRSSRAANVG